MPDIQEQLESLPSSTEPFKPYSHLDGSALTVYVKGDADYAEQMTPQVVLYRSLDTGELAGFRVEGVQPSRIP